MGFAFVTTGARSGDGVTVRYFAGAAEAAGRVEESVDLSDLVVARTDRTTAADLRAALIARHGEGFARVLRRCSLLVSGVRADDGDAVPPGAVVDVLPPFAGG